VDVQKIISTQDYNIEKNRTVLQAKTYMEERRRAAGLDAHATESAGLDAHATESGCVPLQKKTVTRVC